MAWQPHEAEDAAGPAPKVAPGVERGKWLLDLVKNPGGANRENAHEAESEAAAGRTMARAFLDAVSMGRSELTLDLRRRHLSDEDLRAGLSPELRKAMHQQVLGKQSSQNECCHLNVDVSENSITADGTADLVDFVHSLNQMPGAATTIHLRTLRIYKNRLGDLGAQQVARLLMTQPAPVHELHLSHNRIRHAGAAAILLAFGINPAKVYPFRLRNELFGACWVRLEQNEIADPSALLKVLAGKPGFQVTATSNKDGGLFGPGRAPSWAKSPDKVPQAVLHVFPRQVNGKGYAKGGMDGCSISIAEARILIEEELGKLRHIVLPAAAAESGTGSAAQSKPTYLEESDAPASTSSGGGGLLPRKAEQDLDDPKSGVSLLGYGSQQSPMAGNASLSPVASVVADAEDPKSDASIVCTASQGGDWSAGHGGLEPKAPPSAVSPNKPGPAGQRSSPAGVAAGSSPWLASASVQAPPGSGTAEAGPIGQRPLKLDSVMERVQDALRAAKSVAHDAVRSPSGGGSDYSGSPTKRPVVVPPKVKAGQAEPVISGSGSSRITSPVLWLQKGGESDGEDTVELEDQLHQKGKGYFKDQFEHEQSFPQKGAAYGKEQFQHEYNFQHKGKPSGKDQFDYYQQFQQKGKVYGKDQFEHGQEFHQKGKAYGKEHELQFHLKGKGLDQSNFEHEQQFPHKGKPHSKSKVEYEHDTPQKGTAYGKDHPEHEQQLQQKGMAHEVYSFEFEEQLQQKGKSCGKEDREHHFSQKGKAYSIYGKGAHALEFPHKGKSPYVAFGKDHAELGDISQLKGKGNDHFEFDQFHQKGKAYGKQMFEQELQFQQEGKGMGKFHAEYEWQLQQKGKSSYGKDHLDFELALQQKGKGVYGKDVGEQQHLHQKGKAYGKDEPRKGELVRLSFSPEEYENSMPPGGKDQREIKGGGKQIGKDALDPYLHQKGKGIDEQRLPPNDSQGHGEQPKREEESEQQEVQEATKEEMLIKAIEVMESLDTFADQNVVGRWMAHLSGSDDPMREAGRIMACMRGLVRQGFCLGSMEQASSTGASGSDRSPNAKKRGQDRESGGGGRVRLENSISAGAAGVAASQSTSSTPTGTTIGGFFTGTMPTRPASSSASHARPAPNVQQRPRNTGIPIVPMPDPAELRSRAMAEPAGPQGPAAVDVASAAAASSSASPEQPQQPQQQPPQQQPPQRQPQQPQQHQQQRTPEPEIDVMSLLNHHLKQTEVVNPRSPGMQPQPRTLEEGLAPLQAAEAAPTTVAAEDPKDEDSPSAFQ